MSIRKTKKGFTFVELTITIGISLVAMLMIIKFLSSTRHHYIYGTVNLQNLQEARLAINYLRRDFSCACPRLDEPIDDEDFVNFQIARKQIFATTSWTSGSESDLIQVLPHGLLFYRYSFDSPDEKPRVMLVRYEFDQAAKTLVRIGQDGKMQKFTGIQDVEFKVYVHQINERVPILWARLLIHEGENLYGSEKIGNALELTTSISSPFLNSSVNNKYWRFETGHQKL
jgi:type II secretory pathway component PulJ